MITMGLVFVPKILAVVREGNEKSDRSSAPEGGTTKEDEERYQKLQSENEQLQKLLQQKEERLKLLRQKLEEKNASRRKVDIVGVIDESASSRLTGQSTKSTTDKAEQQSSGGKGSSESKASSKGASGTKNNNLEHIEVLETYYNEPSAESGIGQGLSVQTRTPTTTEFELSESYL